MSVVNKMLRDLESREKQQAANANYVPQKKTKHWIVTSVVMVISTSVIATFYVSTTFTQDTNQSVNDPKDIHIEKLSTDRYADNKIGQNDSTGLLQHNSVTKTQKININEQDSSSNTLTDIESEQDLVSTTVANIKSENKKALTDYDVTAKRQDSLSKHNLEKITTDTETGLKDFPLNASVVSKNEQVVHQKNEHKQAAKAIEISPAKAVVEQPEYFAQTLVIKPSDGAKQQLSNLRAQAHIASRAGNDTKVIKFLNDIVVLEPSDQKSRKQLAALLFSNARVEEASNVLHEGLLLAPAESSLRLMLARAYFKSGDTQNAFNVLSEHPYQQMASDELLSFRAALSEKLGLYSQAQIDYQTLVNRNPSQAKWWLGLGVAQDKQKLVSQAINSYQQAKALNQLPVQVDSFVSKRLQLLERES